LTRRSYISANSFQLWVGIAAAIGALFFWFYPAALGSSSVGRSVGALDDLWNALYFVGGVATVYGVVRPSVRGEITGLSLLTAALITQAAAQLVRVGKIAVPSVVILVCLSVACLDRLNVLWSAYHIDRRK
jgi:hypothetical protein